MKNLMAALIVTVSVAAHAETVLVQDNRTDQNHLLAYHINHAGQIRALGALATGGKGFVDSSFALGPFDSDQEVITNQDKSLIFTVNGGSNTISVFCILEDGRIVPAPGSPFASHGSQPVSLGLNGDILTVVNKHGDPAQVADSSLPNYTNFVVRGDGSLRWIANSTVSVPAGSSPSQALVHEGLPFVFGADFLGGSLQSFKVSSSGALVQNAPMMLPAALFPNDGGKTPHAPLGMAIHPKKNIIYVGLPTVNKIGVFRFDRAGVLSFVRAIDDSGQVVCWLTTNRAGNRLYASNTIDASITVYDITTADSPVEIQKLKLQTMGGTYQIALSPNERHLGVITQRYQATTPQGQGNDVHILNVDSKGMVSVSSSVSLDLPGDTRPQGILFLN